METAASHSVDNASWKVTSDGQPLATVVSYRDDAGIVVTAQIFGAGDEADRIRPYRFLDATAAESFVRDLVASFSYLGCHVSHA